MRSGGAAQKIMKRRGVLIALRAAVISSVALDLPCRTISVPIALFQSPLAPNPQPQIPSRHLHFSFKRSVSVSPRGRTGLVCYETGHTQKHTFE